MLYDWDSWIMRAATRLKARSVEVEAYQDSREGERVIQILSHPSCLLPERMEKSHDEPGIAA